ncbi:MAG TPA: serine hydrolase [Gemmatimonadaceae bacterium]
MISTTPALSPMLLSLVTMVTAAPRTHDTDSLRQAIERRVAAVPGAVVAVAWRDLETGDSLDIAADSVFHAASTMKVPVMIELFRRHERGELPLDGPILLRNEFASIVDGSPYALDAGDDSDSALYARVGSPVPVRELMRRMIDRSSNLATNALIELVGATRVTATAAALGAPGMRVLRGVEDGKAYEAGLSNTTTARALASLMRAIETRRAGDSSSTAEMRAILLGQQFNDEIPAGLPPGTLVAHKTGSITAIRHDAAIVYPPGRAPYVLVILTRGIPDPGAASALMADISRLVWGEAMGADR